MPVSFSIRAKPEKESAPLERSALPLEESEDEEGEGDESSAAASATEANGDTRPDKGTSLDSSRTLSQGTVLEHGGRLVPILAEFCDGQQLIVRYGCWQLKLKYRCAMLLNIAECLLGFPDLSMMVASQC